MKKRHLLIMLLLLSLAAGISPLPMKAEPLSTNNEIIDIEIKPVSHTSVELAAKATDLAWFEDHLAVEVNYSLVNPTDKKLKLALQLFYNNSSLPASYHPKVKLNKVSDIADIPVNIQYNAGTYSWEISFESSEELVMTLTYCLPREVNNAGLVLVDYTSLPSDKWSKIPDETTLRLGLEDVHLGQVQEIEPLSYEFQDNKLTWTWGQGQRESILLKADIFEEKRLWDSLITQKERNELSELVADNDYLSAAELFRVKALSSDSESRLRLKEVQGYYLIKAGLSDDALTIWQELYENKSDSPRVYWELGKHWSIEDQRKIANLYDRVRNLQVNALVQEWLASQLQPNQVKLSKPAKPLVEVNNEGIQEGVLLQIKVADQDGDLQEIIVNYQWEDQSAVENVIKLIPFNYEHSTSLFITAPGPLKTLNYEVIAVDKKNNQVSSGEKEVFFLNNQLKGPVFSLPGGMLVLAEYSQQEQDKIDKWFRSYLKIAREVRFVNLEQFRPYFIFVGQEHEFISHYQGPHFILYTPSPFNPDETRSEVHRFILSHCYGPGWKDLPKTELSRLGDALLLGRGRYVLPIKYLFAKDPIKFSLLLNHIGRYADFPSALTQIYDMGLREMQIRALWHAYGNMVIAVLLIILFAWLGKNGQITRLITFIRERR